MAATCVGLKEYEAATRLLDQLAERDAFDWRVIWLRGFSLLAQGKAKESYPFFDAVFSELPGELAPKLALAIVSELLGERESAIRLYDLVSSVDPSYTTASFGLARCMVADNDRAGAVTAFGRVPPLSIAYLPALMQQVRTLIHPKPQPPSPAEIARAGMTLEAIDLPGYDRYRLEADLFEEAVAVVENSKTSIDPTLRLLGEPLNDPTRLRLRAEAALRKTAKFASSPESAIKLIDEANRVRPRTLFS